jgi:homoaconitate hydratase
MNASKKTAQNLVEKIAQRYTVGLPEGGTVHSGDYVSIQPAHVLTHDNTGAVMKKFKSIGATQMANPRQPVFALDHNVQDKGDANLEKYASIERFAREMGVDFYPAGRGIGHQIMVEEGYAFPGTMAVASDSHSNMYGGIGCLGTPVVRTDAAALWATGCTWWQVPKVAKVVLTGRLEPGVTGKDVIVTLCGLFNKDEVLNHALEFSGDAVVHLSIEERLTIANMTTEWGGLVGLFPVDGHTLDWLHRRVELIEGRGIAEHPRLNRNRIEELERNLPRPDADAFYSKELSLDLSSVRPHVSGPNQVKVMTSVSELEARSIPIQKAYLVSCVNSRVGDLAAAADVMRGKKVADGVEFYIAAASSEVQEESERRGDWQVLVDAGARVLPPGCGPCIGLGAGLLEDGEVGISSTNRNFKGRMGSRNAGAYLASPAVVAASALAGKITGPTEFDQLAPRGSIKETPQPASLSVSITVLPDFPEIWAGEIVFCHQDNLNTDGIYPGKYTYIDDFKPEEQARVVMENYDPNFAVLVKEGDVLVGGFNFGAGSSREQAVTALKYRGIRMVVGGSFSETYKRNALNNGFLVLEAPELVKDLKERFGTSKPTVQTHLEMKLDIRFSSLWVDGRTYSIGSVGPAAQELIIEGGLENWVKKRLMTGDPPSPRLRRGRLMTDD